MKVINIKLVCLLFLSSISVGCRTGSATNKDKKDDLKIVWQSHLTADLNQLNKTPLHNAVEDDNLEEIQKLLKGQTSLEVKDQFGATPLQLATVNGNLAVVKLLLKTGANPDGHNFSKQTALHFAALNGFEEIAEELIKFGAKVNSIDDEYWTPLDCALWKGKGIIKIESSEKAKVTDLLIRYGGKRGEIHDH